LPVNVTTNHCGSLVGSTPVPLPVAFRPIVPRPCAFPHELMVVFSQHSQPSLNVLLMSAQPVVHVSAQVPPGAPWQLDADALGGSGLQSPSLQQELLVMHSFWHTLPLFEQPHWPPGPGHVSPGIGQSKLLQQLEIGMHWLLQSF